MYVLDTNTLICFFKRLGCVAERLLNTAPKEIAIPSVVLYELEMGIAKSQSPKKRIKQLEEMASLINVIAFGVKEAKASALIRARLERQGDPIGPYDILIAGTALAHGSTLVTHNINEFQRINGLVLEDWYVASLE